MKRRTVLATSAGIGTTLVAGCLGGDSGTDAGGSPDGDGGSTTGSFRLLISDQPAAIGDFDSLEVTLSSARVFRAGDDETVTEQAVTDTATASPESTPTNTTANGTTANETAATGTATVTETSEDDDGEGFVEFDLDSRTVDLTEVVGERAVSVLEDELEEGRYSGIELSVAGVAGVVEGEAVDVKVPSNRLRIVKPFEIAADAELSFVFDINVVQKGPRNGYNLLPVIGKSGVTGEDVDVEEVEDEDE